MSRASLKGGSGVAKILLLATMLPAGAALSQETTAAPETESRTARPNILWLSSEDNGPHLGAYGDDFADTPNLDALAKRGMRYDQAWSNAPVCAPARATIISGLYPTSTGAQHMRSHARLPEGFRFFPQLLREAGYYTSNNAKEDYNLEKPGQVWDESSRQAHWRNRSGEQPFFAVFNVGLTHESQIRLRPHTPVHDPAAVTLPPYYPDTPEVRQDWAQYYDKMTEMDAVMGQRLAELEEDGLADSTIVFYWGDHGIGLPRGKRTALDSGLRVPLIVSIPKAFRHLASDDWQEGGSSDRLVAFIDFAPTVLSLAGVEIPEHYHGSAFLGTGQTPAKKYLFGFRGRMDERIDMVRTVFDGRYLYSRNYLPHRSHGQHVHYMFQTPTTRVWHERYLTDELDRVQTHFWSPTRSPVELYDLESDPHELVNLADSQEHQPVAEKLSQLLEEHLADTLDVGFLPEAELRERSRDRSPWEMARDARAYPFDQIYRAAELATGPSAVSPQLLRPLLIHRDAAVRYWGVIGWLRNRQPSISQQDARRLARLLEDPSPSVAVAAAEWNVRFGKRKARRKALDVLLERADVETQPAPVVWQALNVLDELDQQAKPVRSQLEALPTATADTPMWAASYVPRLIEKLLSDLD